MGVHVKVTDRQFVTENGEPKVWWSFLTRLDAEQAMCSQVLLFHYNTLPPPILWRYIWSRICGIRWDFRSQKECTYDDNNDRFHEQSWNK